MSGEPCRKLYDAWFTESTGAYVASSAQALLRKLFAGWPRRMQSVLVFNAGSGGILETVWEAGFDVTAQDDNQAYLECARGQLGTRSDFVLSAPDHLPFNDHEFDYAIVAAAFELWKEPRAVLREINRVTARGAIILFPNAWSFFHAECRLPYFNRNLKAAQPRFLSPRTVQRLVTEELRGSKKLTWVSALYGPSATWRAGNIYNRMNNLHLGMPLGAIAGLRIDFDPMVTSTPLLLRAKETLTAAESQTCMKQGKTCLEKHNGHDISR